MTSVSDKNCRENQNMFHVQQLFFPEYRAVYEKMWKNMVWPDGNIIRRMLDTYGYKHTQNM